MSVSRGEEDKLHAFGEPSGDAGFTIPRAPVEYRETRWLGYSEELHIAGFFLRKGFLYVGPILLAPSGKTDPALIDPGKSVALSGHYSEAQGDQRLGYAEASPSMRRAYLQWLADGRTAPNADISLVFLFFYGLERRLILDILRDGASRRELPLLYRELKRLYTLYAGKSASFRRHCAQLIELVEVDSSETELYKRDLVAFPTAWGFPFLIRLALGQAVQDRQPIPANLALTWAEHDPAIVRRTAIKRCAAEFKTLFVITYTAMYGEGMRIAASKSKLKLSYQPASPGFDGAGGVDMGFGDTPDISALAEPVTRLQEVLEVCAGKLEAHSQYLARDPDGREKSASILYLPFELWPDQHIAALKQLEGLTHKGPLLTSLVELGRMLLIQEDLAREGLRHFFSVLSGQGLGIEPDLVWTKRELTTSEPIILFDKGTGTSDALSDPAYKIARVSVEMAAAIAHADGDFSDQELEHLHTGIDHWEHLPPTARKRLRAYACLLRAKPTGLASLKGSVGMLTPETRAEVAAFAASMVLADGVASTEEVQLLEQLYQQSGLERKKAYSDIHAGHDARRLPAIGQHNLTSSALTPIALDNTKIAALLVSSDQIGALLARIFTDEPEAPSVQPLAPDPQANTTAVLGLDPPHSSFARALTMRQKWDRDELIKLAEDLGIMLDGALERINEASLDQLDVMFTEGDDPIEINPEIVENLTQ